MLPPLDFVAPAPHAGWSYALASAGLLARHVTSPATAPYLLVRALSDAEIGRLRATCEALVRRGEPARVGRLCSLLDPRQRQSPVDPSEQWAWDMVAEVEALER